MAIFLRTHNFKSAKPPPPPETHTWKMTNRVSVDGVTYYFVYEIAGNYKVKKFLLCSFQ